MKRKTGNRGLASESNVIRILNVARHERMFVLPGERQSTEALQRLAA